MSYIEITSDEITTGEPVSNNTQTKIKDNFIAHESRIASLEGGSAVVYPPIIMRVNSYYDSAVANRILKTTLNFNITITGVRLLIDLAGSAGTTAVDLKYKRGGGSYTSVLSTVPSVAYTAGNDAISSNAVLNPGQVALQTGDILALDIISAQTGAKNFIVRVDYNKT